MSEDTSITIGLPAMKVKIPGDFRAELKSGKLISEEAPVS
jgi:hypothetical protein